MNYYDEKEKENTLKIRELISSLPFFCKDFFRSIEPRTTSKTRIAYCYDLQVFFSFLKNNNPELKKREIVLSDLDSISFIDLEEYMEYLKYYKDKNNLEISNSNVGIKRKIATLRTFYKYYYYNNLITTNPAAKVSLPKLRDKEIIRLDVNEVADFLDSVESGEKLSKREQKFHDKTKLRDLAMLTLLLGTGIRVSECVGINLSDVDIKNTAIKIKRKGAKEAIIYFSDEVLKPISEYIEYRKTIENVDEKNADALFLSLQNKRITARAVEKLVKKYAEKVTPLKHITPHKLRSTFGTNLYQETDDIYLVASVLGHNDVNTTKKHYAAIEDTKKRLSRNIVKLRDEKK
ncbi:MAG: tyrosine-type recombinase/integrase [Lachnospiraceae bacterium]|nr:tyrosine-type recombinase/integrase [Lachnospiraceae bacterium]